MTWMRRDHARVTWHGKPPASITLPATIATAGECASRSRASRCRWSASPGTPIRRVTVPPPPSVTGIPVDAFVINTAASNSSLAFHLGAVARGHPDRLAGAGERLDPRARPTNPRPVAPAAAGLPIWPSLANDSTNPAGDRSAAQQPERGQRAGQRDGRGDPLRRLHGHQRGLRGDARQPTRRRSPRSSSSSRPRSTRTAPS